uniref:Aspartic peptidase DDI1-type domain-containing protein n=1 Tax=Fagus sylvatica TaxID=28930 RepID=A0A2N9FAX8_FAGSY
MHCQEKASCEEDRILDRTGKYKDLGYPTISCTIGDYIIEHALLDLGASVNLLPFSVYLQLGLGELKPTFVTLQLADRSVRKPTRVVEDVLEWKNEDHFGSMTAELNIFNVNPQQLVDEELLEEEQVVVAKKPPRIPSKMSVEIEKEGEKIKTFERHKTKRKVFQDTRLSKKLLNSSKGVALHVARMKSVRGSNYSFGGSRSGG